MSEETERLKSAAWEAAWAEAEARLHEVREIYAGMEGFIPETAPEGYQQRIIQQMYEATLPTSKPTEDADK